MRFALCVCVVGGECAEDRSDKQDCRLRSDYISVAGYG